MVSTRAAEPRRRARDGTRMCVSWDEWYDEGTTVGAAGVSLTFYPTAPQPNGVRRSGRDAQRPGRPEGATGPSGAWVDQAWTASSSDATFFTRLGSTWMPGPIVVETVIFLM